MGYSDRGPLAMSDKATERPKPIANDQRGWGMGQVDGGVLAGALLAGFGIAVCGHAERGGRVGEGRMGISRRASFQRVRKC